MSCVSRGSWCAQCCFFPVTLSVEPETLGHIQAVRNGIACLKVLILGVLLLWGVPRGGWSFPKGCWCQGWGCAPLCRAHHCVAVGGRCSGGSMRGKYSPAKEQSLKSRLCWERVMLNCWNYLCYQCAGFVSRLGMSVPLHALEYPLEVYFPRSLRGFSVAVSVTEPAQCGARGNVCPVHFSLWI